MSTKKGLADKLLAVPEAPPVAARGGARPTRELTVQGDRAEATVNTAAAPRAELEGKARDLLEAYSLDPAEWEVTGFRTSSWTMANGDEGVSARFSFGRVGSPELGRIPSDELVKIVKRHRARKSVERPDGDHAFIVAIGDTQFGKVDGDGWEGTLERVISYINKAADLLAFYRTRYRIGHVHIAFLGDHIEGFVSQGGANTWRTNLSLTEQVRLVRRVMLHAVETFAPLAERVTVAAVPGNHDQAHRVGGKGTTTYSDSHDVEALIAVADATKLDPKRYGHVEFFVPERDEIAVTLDVAGTTVAHVHGHFYRPGQHFKWWEGQAFGSGPLAAADVLLAAHYHHELIERSGHRLFVQVPAMESESTWFRHQTGTEGNPGLIVGVTRGGVMNVIEVVR